MRKTALLLLSFLISFASAWAQNPVPFVNQPLVPGAAVPGGSSFTLAVSGCMFVPGATVDWDGQPLKTTFISQSKLTAAIPASDVATPQTVRVTVVNPESAVVSNVVFFDVTTPESSVYYEDAPGYPTAIVSPGALAEVSNNLISGDLLGNGIEDLASGSGAGTSPSDFGLSVSLGNGDGTFRSLPLQPPHNLGCCSVAEGDFTGNGRLDLALGAGSAPSGTGSVVIMLNNGNGTFTQASGSPIPDAQNPVAIAVGDFNHDGNLDLAVINEAVTSGGVPTGGSVMILLGNGNGAFTQAPGSPIAAPSILDGLSGVTVGDFNGDGNLDLAVEAGNNGYLWTLLGNGDGTFGAAPQSPTSIKGMIYPGGIDAGDFNGDGKLDLAVSGFSQTSTIAVLLGNGDGTFTQVPDCCGINGNLGPIADVYSQFMAMGDFNGDGKLDLAVLSEVQNLHGADIVQLFLGKADGTFSETDYAVLMNNPPSGIVAGPFDRSGRLGMVVVGGGPQAMWSFVQVPQSQWPYPPPAFTVTAQNPSLSVSPGGSVTDNITVSSQNGFYGPVSFSCSGAPALATCTVGTQTRMMTPLENLLPTLTITTTAPPAASSLTVPTGPGSSSNSRPVILWTLCAGLALCLWLTRRWRKAGYARIFVLAALISLGAFSSCGGQAPVQSQPAPKAPQSTPAGTYTITVTATSPSGGGLTHSTTVTLNVQ